jgi:DNA invertase Pin-like site-specific DNA recombinase
MDRPGLERLLADVRSGKITRVVVWRLDRLGRTAKGLLTLLDELQALAVGFVSLREGFDLGTPAGRLMAGVLASVAAYETEVRKERQLAGIAKAQAEGKRWGGRKAGTRVRLTEEKETLIRRLHGEGKPVAAIARLVGLTRKTCYRALSLRAEVGPPRDERRAKAHRPTLDTHPRPFVPLPARPAQARRCSAERPPLDPASPLGEILVRGRRSTSA